MIDDLLCSDFLKKNLKNELADMKESGTYLLYGLDKKALYEIAISFAKSLNCKEKEMDFCDECESCVRFNSATHGDLEVYRDDNGIKIEEVRKLISKSGSSSYEGGNKIFILEDINKMKPVASNALLKTIEEPLKGNYYFLLTTSLNILATIKSRSTIIRVPQLNYELLGVSKDIFEFFNGSGSDIKQYKKILPDLNETLNYLDIEKFIVEYYSNGEKIQDKIKIYNALRYFVKNYKWLNKIDKLKFIESICRAAKTRDEIYQILDYIGCLKNDSISVKKLLETKNKLRLPVLVKGILIELFL